MIMDFGTAWRLVKSTLPSDGREGEVGHNKKRSEKSVNRGGYKERRRRRQTSVRWMFAPSKEQMTKAEKYGVEWASPKGSVSIPVFIMKNSPIIYNYSARLSRLRNVLLRLTMIAYRSSKVDNAPRPTGTLGNETPRPRSLSPPSPSNMTMKMSFGLDAHTPLSLNPTSSKANSETALGTSHENQTRDTLNRTTVLQGRAKVDMHVRFRVPIYMELDDLLSDFEKSGSSLHSSVPVVSTADAHDKSARKGQPMKVIVYDLLHLMESEKRDEGLATSSASSSAWTSSWCLVPSSLERRFVYSQKGGASEKARFS